MQAHVPVTALLAICNPYGTNLPWGETVFRSDVEAAIEAERLVGTPGSDDHAGRIAFLVLNPAEDCISLDVGIPVLGYPGPNWKIVDGNHRFAAAVYRGDESISAEISGQLSWARELFGLDELALQVDHERLSPSPNC